MNKLNLNVIILRGIILFPNNEIRIELDKEDSKNVIEIIKTNEQNKVLVVNKIDELEETNVNLPNYGVIGTIDETIELPNNKIRIDINGIKRVKILEYFNLNTNLNIKALVEEIEIEKIEEKKEKVFVNKLKKEIEKYIHELPYVSNSIINVIKNVTDLNEITDVIAPYLNVSQDRLLVYLNELDCVKRASMIVEDINEEIESYNIERELDIKVNQEVNKNQREYLLKEKIKAIKLELGEASLKDEEVSNLYSKVDQLKANENIKLKIKNEIKRYENLSNMSPEADIVRNYIDWMVSLPWNQYTIDNDDLEDVRMKLDKTHNGLEEVKSRIIEYLAVKQMTNNLRGPIICLVGPPGVGKTSLAFSIANSMNRNFVKISVGGINDEAELIGHRRTYLGANPGRIISSLKKASSSNPVFLIDEIDKMMKNYKGDPASVLLEILDPEQNKYFSDNYIEEEYDLSKVMFIATANTVEDIPLALRDRLEIVMLSGYTEYEKLDIARNYLLPKICKEHGINIKGIEIKDELLLKIIRNYTKEAGVRELDRLLSTIIRKVITTLSQKRICINKFIIDKNKIKEYLGIEKYLDNPKIKNDIGVVNGLAYTTYGGDTLQIEVNIFKGNGKLILTGSLGEVMKESALIALDYIKANYKSFKINYDKLINSDIHIHFPEGAIPKDGPSAGISITTAIISALTNLKVPSNLALTGEITLRGNVLSIGGLKEKSMGASRNNIKTIIIPDGNIKDLDKIDKKILEEIEFIPVKNYKEVYKIIKGDK